MQFIMIAEICILKSGRQKISGGDIKKNLRRIGMTADDFF